jgi:hypothetical protein
MLSLSTASKLKQAGLQWQPAEHDAFFIPFHDLDERVFVISDMSVIVEAMGDEQAITFNGTAEWALDYLVLTDAIWVPSESQLRELLEQALVQRGEEQPVLALSTTTDGYRCTIRYNNELMQFDDFGASEAYAAALLFVLTI